MYIIEIHVLTPKLQDILGYMSFISYIMNPKSQWHVSDLSNFQNTRTVNKNPLSANRSNESGILFPGPELEKDVKHNQCTLN